MPDKEEGVKPLSKWQRALLIGWGILAAAGLGDKVATERYGRAWPKAVPIVGRAFKTGHRVDLHSGGYHSKEDVRALRSLCEEAGEDLKPYKFLFLPGETSDSVRRNIEETSFGNLVKEVHNNPGKIDGIKLILERNKKRIKMLESRLDDPELPEEDKEQLQKGLNESKERLIDFQERIKRAREIQGQLKRLGEEEGKVEFEGHNLRLAKLAADHGLYLRYLPPKEARPLHEGITNTLTDISELQIEHPLDDDSPLDEMVKRHRENLRNEKDPSKFRMHEKKIIAVKREQGPFREGNIRALAVVPKGKLDVTHRGIERNSFHDARRVMLKPPKKPMPRKARK